MSSFCATRRGFLKCATLSIAGSTLLPSRWKSFAIAAPVAQPLDEFDYGQIALHSELHQKQLQNSISVLMGLNEDSLLKPIRQMGGKSAPGEELGGWYNYDPNYDWHTFDAGFAPGATFGQWVSALARAFAITGSNDLREKVLRLNRLYAEANSDGFFEKNRFPAYCFDKLVCGFIDSHRWARDPDAFSIMQKMADTALRHMPEHAITHGESWKPGTDESWTWDESYTIPENLFLAYQRGAGERYKQLGQRYLLDTFFGPLAEGHNAFTGRHAYSHVNALSSAMQAYLTLGSEMHFEAAKNGFEMLTAQSFATGGWGPGEQLRATGSPDVFKSLSDNHSSFETPCGAYAHFKLTRYLLRVTRDSRYGDSMERVMYNTILGAKPLESDGHSFYYSDYSFQGRKVYSDHRWPCCSGTYPQVATDYGINSYFRDEHGVFINLYIPSTLSWIQNGAKASLTQRSSYPLEGNLEFEFSLSKPTEFTANFRVPAWAEGASLAINGKRVDEPIVPGTFASIYRTWRDGDRVELELPMKMRLESLDESHPDTVALLRGPLVLFATSPSKERITRQQLLGSKNVGSGKWQVETTSGPMTMLPFTAIEDQQYSTYLNVSG